MFSDIRSFAVVAGPGEVRYCFTAAGELQVYVGAGLKAAPEGASRARIDKGFTTFVIRPNDEEHSAEESLP